MPSGWAQWEPMPSGWAQWGPVPSGHAQWGKRATQRFCHGVSTAPFR